MRNWTRHASVLAVASAVLALNAPAHAGRPPDLQFRPSPAPAYGNVAVGQSVDRTFILTNNGGSATAALSITLVPTTAFTIPAGGDRCTASSVGPKKACSVTVRYTPAAAGAEDSAVLTVSAKKQPHYATLTLSGSSSPLTPLAACQQALAAAGYAVPTDPNYIVGTTTDDDFTSQLTTGNDVMCGFAGDDVILEPPHFTLAFAGGDIFVGGDGADFVDSSGATFDGGPGDDSVNYHQRFGTFNGGEGVDSVNIRMFGGTFNGGADGDTVATQNNGTFNGGPGNDVVTDFPGDAGVGGVFNGGDGDDFVGQLSVGSLTATFNGEDGCDAVGAVGVNGIFNPGDQSTCPGAG